jgi:hypothetical protein
MRRTVPFAVVSVVGVLLGLLVVSTSTSDVADGGMLGSEQYLKQMIAYVTPLMAILRKDQLRVKRETTDPIDRDSYGYGGGGGGGYESSYEPCCDDKQDYVAILSLIALGLLFLFLITLLSTSTTSGRKKRSNSDDSGKDEDLADFIQDLAHHQDPRNDHFYFYFYFSFQ